MPRDTKTEQHALNDTEALQLKTAGYTYPQIAQMLGIAQSTAHGRVQRALAAIPAMAVEEYRAIEGERLDHMLKVATDKALSGDKGALFAIDRVLAIMDRRARLLGLDAPVKTQTEVVTYSGDTIEARVAELRNALGQVGSSPILLD